MKKNLSNLTLVLVLSFILNSSFAQTDLEDINFGKHRILHSEILDQDRILYVNLPANYENSTESYPVVFQLYSHFMENYYLPAVRTTSIMGRSSLAPEMIVVGIMNREFRYRDLLPEAHWGGESEIDNFLSFFEKELIPFIESKYRTRDYRIISGPQAGAAFGLYALCEKPDLFDAFFLTSPFWIKSSRETIFNKFSDAVDEIDFTNKFMMLTYGKYESDEELEYIQKFEKLSKAIPNESFTFFSNKIDTNFGFSSPVNFEKGMKKLFQDYPFPGADHPQNLEVIEKHFKKLSDKLGYPVKITEHALVFEGDKFNRIKDYENALILFQRMHEIYPEGLMGFDRLGGVYRSLGEYNESIKYYEMFLEKQPGNPHIEGLIKAVREEQKNK